MIFNPVTWMFTILSLACVSIALARGEILDPLKELLIRFAPVRIDAELTTLLYCPMCIGFWVGLSGSIIFSLEFTTQFAVANHLLAAFSTSIFGIGIDKLIWGRNNDTEGNT